MGGAPEMSPGYSLIELLVVLAIMSLVLMVAVPAATATVERTTLSADARALTTALRTLRTAALDRQTDIVLTTTSAGHALATSQGASIRLSSGTAIEIAGNDRRFLLRWDGTASGTIDLRRGDASVRVTADRLTGRFAVVRVR